MAGTPTRRWKKRLLGLTRETLKQFFLAEIQKRKK
jgi:hypothetical protein